MFNKYTCHVCGEKYKKSTMAKDKSGNYTCVYCQKLMSRYFPGCFKSTSEQITENISYMKKQKELYSKLIENDKDIIQIKNDNLGIIISEKYGVFKVIDNEWGWKYPDADCELFRLDQINRYEVFDEILKNVYINNNAFVECGERIYMNSERDEKYNKYRIKENQKTHPYINSINIYTAVAENYTPSDTLQERGLKVAEDIVGCLDRLLGGTKEEASEKRNVFGEAADRFFIAYNL